MGLDDITEDIGQRLKRGMRIITTMRERYRDQVQGAWMNAFEDEIILFCIDRNFSYDESFPGYKIRNLPIEDLELLKPTLRHKGGMVEFYTPEEYAVRHGTPQGES